MFGALSIPNCYFNDIWFGYTMTNYQKYWNENIEDWGKFYLQVSHGHETLHAPHWLSKIYNRTIARHEARLMQERFSLTLQFMDKNIRSGQTFVDIGCGTGIFTVEALKRGANVIAIDFSSKALEITKMNVDKHISNAKVEFHKLNIAAESLPESDVSIMVGVAPYVQNIEQTMDNVLSSTKKLFGHFVDPKHWANTVRSALPVLNVRRLIFHERKIIDAAYKKNEFILENRKFFGTGYLDEVKQKT